MLKLFGNVYLVVKDLLLDGTYTVISSPRKYISLLDDCSRIPPLLDFCLIHLHHFFILVICFYTVFAAKEKLVS